MSIIDRFIDSFRRPPGPIPTYTPDVSRAFLLGPAVVERSDMAWGHDATQFSPEEYLRYVATSNGVFSCIKLRQQLLSSLPIKFYRTGGTGKRREIESGPLVELFTRVNPRWTFPRLLEMWEASLCLTGQTYTFLERGTSARRPPTEMWWGRSDRVKVIPDPTEYIAGFFYEPVNGGVPIRYRPDEVFWARYPNPIDEFAGLAPLAAARLAADSASDAMKSNRNLFVNGIQMGGVVLPRQGMPMFTKEQADQAAEALSRGAKGVDNAHRWQVFRLDADMKTLTMSPKDAEFLGLLKWSLEDICRAFGVPLDLVGGERTYANQKDARLAIWTDTILPEARFLASEITEQILPMFNEADLAEFDTSQVPALREYEAQMWSIAKEQIEKGAKTINQYLNEKGDDPVAWGDAWWVQTAGGGYAPVTSGNAPIAANQEIQFGGLTVNEHRKAKGLPPVPWGNVWWADVSKVPVSSEGDVTLPMGAQVVSDDDQNAPGDEQDLEDDVRSLIAGIRRETAASERRTVEYGSAEHERLWQRAVTRTEPWERKVAEATADLMRRQKQSILTELRKRRAIGQRATEADLAKLMDDILSLPRWTREFRSTMRPVFTAIAQDVGDLALKDLGIGTVFDVKDPNVIRAMERQAQRFAKEVNQTTWDQLRSSLADGLDKGESIDTMAKRVEGVMGDRIRSSGETIARTEVTTASNAGTLESWRQSGVVQGKQWLAALDDRTRAEHAAAHGQTVGIDEMFSVGGDTGPGPGMMGSAENDCNCRCSMTAVLDTEPRTVAQNGHGHRELLRLAQIVGVRE